MSFSLFFRRFFFHVVAAASVLLLICMVLERLVPGIALPFVDLTYVALWMGVAAFVCVYTSEGPLSHLKRVVALVFIGAVAACVALLVVLRLVPLDGRELIAVGSGCVLVSLTLYAFAVE